MLPASVEPERHVEANQSCNAHVQGGADPAPQTAFLPRARVAAYLQWLPGAWKAFRVVSSAVCEQKHLQTAEKLLFLYL